MLQQSGRLLLAIAAQMALSIAFDAFLLSSFPFSMLVWFLRREGLRLFASGFSLDWSWLKEWLRTGGLSGLESLVTNATFVLMVIRLINIVQEQGTFWVTNSFIWDWLEIVSIGFYGRGPTDLMLHQSLIVGVDQLSAAHLGGRSPTRNRYRSRSFCARRSIWIV